MEIVISSEFGPLLPEGYRKTYRCIEDELIREIGQLNYGEGVKDWFHLFITVGESLTEFFPEKKKYIKKRCEVETRLIINYNEMKNADEKKMFRLFCESVLKSIQCFHELKVINFDIDGFYKEVKKLFIRKNWLENK